MDDKEAQEKTVKESRENAFKTGIATRKSLATRPIRKKAIRNV